MRYRFIRKNYYAFAVTAVPVLALVSCGLFAQTIQLSKIELREFGPQPIQIDLHMLLDFSKNANISFTPVHTTKQPLVLNPSNVDRADFNRQSVNAGKVTIWVSPTGTRFLNRDRGVSYFAETLTSQVVRQQTIVYDPNRSTVWLYGEALYRYRIGTNELEKIQPSSGTQVMFRKLVVTHAGVWLATDDGAYQFNNADETLRRVVQTERLSLINATAIGKTIWFADEQTRLIKFDTSIPNRITFAVSSKLPFGAPAEMLNANNGLWMLLSTKDLDAYRVGYLNTSDETLNVLGGKYFSLRVEGNKLVANAYGRQIMIDSVAHTTAEGDVGGNAMRATIGETGEITFLGSSYSMRDPSEVVQRRPFDLSRGWFEPGLLSRRVAGNR